VLATELGAGRQKADDLIDATAGIVLKKKTGDRVDRGGGIAEIFSDRRGVVERVRDELASCITIGDAPVQLRPRIRSIVDNQGVTPWSTPQLH
jgi:pyrimidine-nucleoside phosphorylase